MILRPTLRAMGLALWAAAAAIAAFGAVASPASGAEPESAERPAACCYNIRLLTNEGEGYIGRVLSMMEANGDLTFEPVFNGEALSPQQVWRDRYGFWINRFRDSGLESWLCDHNPQICRKATGFDRMQKAPPGAPVSVEGLRCGEALPAYVICLPRVKMAPYRETITREIERPAEKPTENLQAIVANLGGCETWDAKCRLLIARLNATRPDAVDPRVASYKGPIRLPFRAIRIEQPTRAGETYPAQTARIDIFFKRFYVDAGLADRKGVYVVLTDDRPRRAPPSSQALASVADGLKAEQQARAAMAYPFADDPGRALRDALPPVTVAVWDRYVDEGHCAFLNADQSAVRYPDTVSRDRLADANALPPRAAGPCATYRISFAEPIDHGTAVAGVISAKDQSNAPGGLHPKAEIWAKNLRDLLELEGDPLLEFQLEAKNPLAVINVSQAIPEGPGSQFDRILFGDAEGSGNIKNQNASDLVVVIAAGNDGALYTGKSGPGACRLYPACLGDRADGLAVITVAASNTTGDILRCGAIDTGRTPVICQDAAKSKAVTNYGREFDVLAPGVAFTTFYGDTFGAEAGTSMAAPRVSALASLLIAAASRPLPEGARALPHALDVRARILSTADPLFSAGGEPFSRYGAINFTRAMAFETSLVEPAVHDSQVCDEASGDCRSTRWKVKPGQLTAQLNGKPFMIDWAQILRLQQLEETANGVRAHLAYIDPNNLQALRQAVVEVGYSQRVTFFTEANEKWIPRVTDVKEYTACAFAQGCPSLAPPSTSSSPSS